LTTSRQRLYRLRRPAWLGTLRRTTPLSDGFGFERGTPVDRYYIDRFVEQNRSAIRGHVLEVKNSKYTKRFGVGVTERSVLDVDPTNPAATIVADLAAADAIIDDTFDCFILTQTLQFIYNARAALFHAHRILRPGGVLLCTVPAVARISPGCLDSEYWRFTRASCEALFGEVFPPEKVIARTHGNVLTSIAALTGMAMEELKRRELDRDEDHFPTLVSVRAEKAG
jgi:SAM-dependent methyltransferase